MDSTNLFGGIVALISADVWGTGDFVVGLTSRNRSQYQVLALAALAGMVSLLIAMFIRSEPWPEPVSILWSCTAGISGAIGMASLYQGLAIAQAALVAPTAAVISVVFPVFVVTIMHGAPSPEKWVGMAAGMAAIWLVTKGLGSSRDANGLGLAILAGFGFGGFFLCIVQTEPGSVFSPPCFCQNDRFSLCHPRTLIPSIAAAFIQWEWLGTSGRCPRCRRQRLISAGCPSDKD